MLGSIFFNTFLCDLSDIFDSNCPVNLNSSKSVRFLLYVNGLITLNKERKIGFVFSARESQTDSHNSVNQFCI